MIRDIFVALFTATLIFGGFFAKDIEQHCFGERAPSVSQVELASQAPDAFARLTQHLNRR